MTETDATNRPLTMPKRFIPYMEKYRIYKLFKEMTQDLLVHLPQNHLKHMKIFLRKRVLNPCDPMRILMLVSPELDIDIKSLVKELVKRFGLFVITRRYIMDHHEKHDDYKPGYVSPELMSEVARQIVAKEPIDHIGWFMFDHPCTVREGRCLQQDGVLPKITLVLAPVPPIGDLAENPLTKNRGFYEQDFDGLKYTYRATVKEVLIEPAEPLDKIAVRCTKAIQAYNAGAQGTGQGFATAGGPGIYRVLLIGPRGSGRSTQAKMISEHFDLVYLNFEDLHREALLRDDDIGDRLRAFGLNTRIKAEIVKRRLDKRDCLDRGWVMIGYPLIGTDFEYLDSLKTPPNRVIFLSLTASQCKERLVQRGYNWCTGRVAKMDSHPKVKRHPRDEEAVVDAELENYFSESLAELRAAAGITAVYVDATQSIDVVQTNIQACIMAAPAFDIEYFNAQRPGRQD